MRLALISLLMIPLVVGCDGEDSSKSNDDWSDDGWSDDNWADTANYELFNCEDDASLIYIGTEDVISDEACDGIDAITLLSSSCEIDVGAASITPCGGPIGTEHEIVVAINTLYIDQVDRVSVRINSVDRGTEEYDLDADAADNRLYKMSLFSVGRADEQRADTIEFRLWARN